MRGWNAAKRLHCKCGISSLHSYPCISSLFGPSCWDTWRKKSSLYDGTNCRGGSGGRRVCGMIRISHASSLPILSWRGVVGKEKNKCIWVKTAGKHARLPFKIICLTRVFVFQVQCDAYICIIKNMGSTSKKTSKVVFCFQFTKSFDLIWQIKDSFIFETSPIKKRNNGGLVTAGFDRQKQKGAPLVEGNKN